MNLVILLILIIARQPPPPPPREAGTFSRDFTIDMAPLLARFKIENLKAPLFPGSEGGESLHD